MEEKRANMCAPTKKIAFDHQMGSVGILWGRGVVAGNWDEDKSPHINSNHALRSSAAIPAKLKLNHAFACLHQSQFPPLPLIPHVPHHRTHSECVHTPHTLPRSLSPDAPAAIGPYSQAIKANGLVFVSGCIPLDPSSMTVVDGGIEAQTTQALKNLGEVVTASGSSVNKVVKTTVRVSLHLSKTESNPRCYYRFS
jgi:hypothetical protein